jgi:hypothetical protein
MVVGTGNCSLAERGRSIHRWKGGIGLATWFVSASTTHRQLGVWMSPCLAFYRVLAKLGDSSPIYLQSGVWFESVTKKQQTMNEKFEMIQHFACQIIKASLERNLVNATHYHAKMDRVLSELYSKIESDEES